MIPPELAALAEDPPAFITPFQGSERIWDQRFCVAINPRRTWVTVCRLRLAPDQVGPTVAEIRELTEGIETATWNVGCSSAEPPDLPVRLRALGLGDPEPPLDAVCAPLVLAEEPPRVAGVGVHPVESLDLFLTGTEIVLAADEWSPEAAERERRRAPEAYERRRRRGGLLCADPAPARLRRRRGHPHAAVIPGGRLRRSKTRPDPVVDSES
jgi:hypothetical protein